MYHAKDGLFFRNNFEDNTITIIKTSDSKEIAADGSNILFSTTLTKSMMASIMANSSISGETTEKYYQAYDFLDS